MNKISSLLLLLVAFGGQVLADVYVRNINAEQDIYPHRPWRDVTPTGSVLERFRISTANLLLQEDRLILASDTKRVDGGGGGCDSWVVLEMDLISVYDKGLIERILRDPHAFEYIFVSTASGWLVDPTTPWYKSFPDTYPISYKRVSVYDNNPSG